MITASAKMEGELSQTLSDERECDKEALHLLGAIQAHGCLLTFKLPEGVILNISSNAGEFLKHPPKECLGVRLDKVIPRELYLAVVDAAEDYPWPGVHGRHITYSHAGFDAYLFQTGGIFALELERLPAQALLPNFETLLKEYIAQTKDMEDLTELSKLTCRCIREISGMDRVMMYQFLPPKMHGEVIAEDKVADAHSYAAHRFPSSDIPKPARALYLRNQVRLIPDTAKEFVSIEPAKNPITNETLDLSDSRLRAVSSVHMEYLRNMRVGSSYSLSVVLQGQLWGLIACHNLKPLQVTQSQRTACEILANIYAVNASRIEATAAANERLEFEDGLRKLFDQLRTSSDPAGDLLRNHKMVCDVFDAGGLALVSGRRVDFAGATPTQADILRMRDEFWSDFRSGLQKVKQIDSLEQIDSGWSYMRELVSGVLAVSLDEADQSMLLVFRPEWIRTITWGGDPRKHLVKRDFNGKLNPRESFDSWTETVKGVSKPWKKHELDGILFLRDFVFGSLVRNERLLQELRRKFEDKRG